MAAGQWPPWEVTSQGALLDDSVRTLHEAIEKKVAPEITGNLARLLVVRASGYVEQCAKELARGFVKEKSGGMPRSFALSWLERSRNPTPEALGELLGRFDATLQSDFEAFMGQEDQHLLRELHFLVDRRNRIAHGLSEGLGHQRALELVLTAEAIVEWLILRLNPA